MAIYKTMICTLIIHEDEKTNNLEDKPVASKYDFP